MECLGIARSAAQSENRLANRYYWLNITFSILPTTKSQKRSKKTTSFTNPPQTGPKWCACQGYSLLGRWINDKFAFVGSTNLPHFTQTRVPSR
jgi:hypothetical protein